jgi:hypothetical protein
MLIRPTVTYGAEMWTLTLTEENALRKFERKVLWKIYGPVMDKGVWRIRYNFELYRFMGGKDSQIYKSTKNTVGRSCREDG